MRINDIKTESDVNIYLDYFSSLKDKDKDNEIEEVSTFMESDNYNNFQFLALIKISDIEGDVETISYINESKKGLYSLINYILDKHTVEKSIHPRYKMKKLSDREIKILDEINYQLDGYDAILKYFNEKIIN